MSRLSADSIVITGLGVCSSLGKSELACAAARAGISMPRELADAVLACRDGTEATLVGHPVAAAAGFRGLGKMVNLGLAALEDLLQTSDIRAEAPEKTGLHLCLRAPLAEAPIDGERLCAQLSTLASLALPQRNLGHLAEGHAGFVHAVNAVSERLRTGALHRCLVGGIDSLLDEPALESLIAAGRAKTPDRPDGLQPGEAGAFVLLERFDQAQRRGAPVIAIVGGASTAVEPDHAESERPCRGVGLTEAIAQLFNSAPAQSHPSFWLLSDLNGEHSRASELGHTLARASLRVPALGAAQRWYPAASFGDTGAASAALATCLGTRAFARGYAPAPMAVILSSSDREPRGALSLKAPSRFPNS
jgi:3-oxoacyl-[acyl-carrier-protein] synthase-1